LRRFFIDYNGMEAVALNTKWKPILKRYSSKYLLIVIFTSH